MNRDRLNRIRTRHARALTLLDGGQLPTNREFIQLIQQDMTDLLNERTNTRRH